MEENSGLRGRVSRYEGELNKYRTNDTRHKKLEQQVSLLETQLTEKDEDKKKWVRRVEVKYMIRMSMYIETEKSKKEGRAGAAVQGEATRPPAVHR